jgi:hypothetical protein
LDCIATGMIHYLVFVDHCVFKIKFKPNIMGTGLVSILRLKNKGKDLLSWARQPKQLSTSGGTEIQCSFARQAQLSRSLLFCLMKQTNPVPITLF